MVHGKFLVLFREINITQNIFDIFTWNARGIKKRPKSFNWMVKLSSINSIFMLQETHSALMMRKTGESSGEANCFSVMEQVTALVF